MKVSHQLCLFEYLEHLLHFNFTCLCHLIMNQQDSFTLLLKLMYIYNVCDTNRLWHIIENVWLPEQTTLRQCFYDIPGQNIGLSKVGKLSNVDRLPFTTVLAYSPCYCTIVFYFTNPFKTRFHSKRVNH